MYCIPDSITQNEKKKIIQRNVVWSFYLYRNAQIYYYASSLRNNSLFLNPHFELWNLSPTILLKLSVNIMRMFVT